MSVAAVLERTSLLGPGRSVGHRWQDLPGSSGCSSWDPTTALDGALNFGRGQKAVVGTRALVWVHEFSRPERGPSGGRSPTATRLF